MDEFDGYLPDVLVQELLTASVQAGLSAEGMLAALVAGIDPFFIASVPTVGPPNAKLALQVHAMNRVHNLRNGDVPLAQWLRQAIFLSGPGPYQLVFERALDYVIPAAGPVAGAGGAAAADGGGAPVERNLEISPEAQIAGADATVDLSFLEGALASARSVVKVLVHRHQDGQAAFLDGDTPWMTNGTAWFIAPEMLITNHHVVNARRTAPVSEPDADPTDFQLQAEHCRVVFDYLRKGDESVVTRTAPGALLTASKDLDFALLRVASDGNPRPPLRLRKHTIRKRPEQPLGIRVNVLQHPNGDPIRLGFRENFVVVGNDAELAYLTDTSNGSSGAPVCDDKWWVAALHAGSRNISAEGLTVRGREVRRENFGVPIRTILAHLEAHEPAIHQEIMEAQVE